MVTMFNGVKIYCLLWFWFVLLATVTGLQLAWRTASLTSGWCREFLLRGQARLLPTVSISPVLYSWSEALNHAHHSPQTSQTIVYSQFHGIPSLFGLEKCEVMGNGMKTRSSLYVRPEIKDNLNELFLDTKPFLFFLLKLY